MSRWVDKVKVNPPFIEEEKLFIEFEPLSVGARNYEPAIFENGVFDFISAFRSSCDVFVEKVL